MRIALISDLHGNEVALQAVFADLGRVGVDQLICLGDVATLGPRPNAVLAMLRERGCPCILGNHDEFLLDPGLIRAYTEAPIVVESVDWCRAQLSPAELDFVATFQRGLRLDLGGGDALLLFHGSPLSHMQDLLATTPPAELDRLLGPHTATVMACGHTHIQMLRQHRGMLLVNPGSVGMPFREYVHGQVPRLMAHAEYAILEAGPSGISVNLRRIPLDKRQLRDAAAASAIPLRPMLVAEYT